MTQDRVLDLLQEVARGSLAPESARRRLSDVLVEDLEYAQVDHLRPLTQGQAEVVFGEGKSPTQMAGVCQALVDATGSFLVTRASPDACAVLVERFPGTEVNELARTAFRPRDPEPPPTGKGTVLVVTAGTSDLPVAEEAAVVARAMGNRVERLTDVGVSGIHRVLRRADALRRAAVVVVAAGMDGALASVVGGMVSAPVIAVPTSVGYGASFGGLSALLAMLNSCAAGVTVVNVDSGFAAGAAASRINHLP